MRRITAFLCAIALVAALLPTAAFSDISEGQPYGEAIAYLSENGLMEGYKDGSFRPAEPITRAELCKLIVMAFPPDSPAEGHPFSDITGHWAEDQIAAVAGMGIVNGYEDGSFRPDLNITCEQAAAVASRLSGSLSPKAYPLGYLTHVAQQGLMDGIAVMTGRSLTRGEAAQMIYNLILLKELPPQEDDILDMIPPGSLPGQDALYVTDEYAPMGDVTIEEDYLIDPEPDYWNTEEYGNEGENRFLSPVSTPFSTFSLDVDTASYSKARSALIKGQLPDPGSIRLEEMMNYFSYDLPRPEAGEAFSVTTEVQRCPWSPEHLLAMVALQGYDLDPAALPASNLVFLIDVSGSMYGANRLPLLKRALSLLVDELQADDTVTIVTYAGGSGVALEPTSGADKEAIKEAIHGLQAAGSTNGAEGLRLAYEMARERYAPDINNRIILCSDGDFNVGVTSNSQLEALVTQERESGIYLSTLGFGMGNYKDVKMELLADKGNGNYAYIDNLKEAKKVLIDDMQSTLFTIARDVKIQVEFNPKTVGEYRLLGYENRLLNTEDFTDDRIDAGEMGAGHSMIAFYEIVPKGLESAQPPDSKYQTSQTTGSDELMTVKLRYKEPDSDTSREVQSVAVASATDAQSSETFQFASAVAELGLLLKASAYQGDASVEDLIHRAYANRGIDPYGYRAEFIQLADLYRLLVR